MSHITILLDQATEARMRAVAEHFDRPVEELACLAITETAAAFFARTPERDPVLAVVLHPLVLTPEVAL